MHIMSFEEFLENGKPEMSVIIQRVADRYKKNYKNTLKRQHVPEYQYKNLCQKEWKVFRKTKDFDAAVKKEMMQGKESRKFFNPKYRKEAEALYDQYLEEMHTRMEEERLKNAVLTAIPERIRDAYPATRQLKRRFVLHIGPTNSGKTYEALQKFQNAEEAVYLAPLRLLALEVYETTNMFLPCSLLTGEEEDIMPGATHISETIEMADLSRHYDMAVIDEAQMISDPSRGGAWTAAILGLCADEIHICMAPHAESIIRKLIAYCGDEIVETDRRDRMTPLIEDTEDFSFPESVMRGDALIVFSKKSVISCAAELQAKGISCSMIYGALPYETRRAETDRFAKGETSVVVATDAIGMGLNLPIKRVVFLETEKFDGYGRRDLLPEEIQQIAGRAGRKGLYECGYYTSSKRKSFIRSSMTRSPSAILFARLGFPRMLIEVEGKLSEVMKRWIHIETESFFLKTDLTEELGLCQWLEGLTDDKEMTYRLMYIPFNTENPELLTLWKESAKMVIDRGYVDIDDPVCQLDEEFGEAVCEGDTNKKIQALEVLHQKYDMFHNFVRLFGMPGRQNWDKKLIRKRKKEISKELTDTIREKKLKRRKCMVCGRNLPFGYPYKLCQPCFEKKKFFEDFFETVDM